MKPAFGNGGLQANRRERYGKVIKTMSATNNGILILCQTLCRCQGKKTLQREVEKTSRRGSYTDIERLGKDIHIDL